MAIQNFIPSVWSETLAEALETEYIGVKHCSRDFEGDIKGKGSCVKISSVGDIQVFDYQKDSDMSAPESLSDNLTTLEIDQAKAFNFQIDDIDRAQANPKLMKAAMKKAAASLAQVADKYVFGLYKDVEERNIYSNELFLAENAAHDIAVARKMLIANGVASTVDTVLEVTPDVGLMLLKSKLIYESETADVMNTGMIGKFYGFEVYVSNNVAVDGIVSHCFARTKRAIAFAEQLNEVEAYRPENRFADAVKGLHLYGAKIVYPNEIIRLDLSV